MKKKLIAIALVIILMMTVLLVSVLADDLNTDAPEETSPQDKIDIVDDQTPLASGISLRGSLSPWAFIISIAGVLVLGTICATILIKERKK